MTGASTLAIGVAQAPFGDDLEPNLARAEDLVRETARAGASIVVLPELFAYPYFCKVERDEFFDLAAPLDGHPVIERFALVSFVPTGRIAHGTPTGSRSRGGYREPPGSRIDRLDGSIKFSAHTSSMT